MKTAKEEARNNKTVRKQLQKGNNKACPINNYSKY